MKGPRSTGQGAGDVARESAKPKKITAAKSRERWAAAAMCLGYNELAKLGKTLAEKTFSRMMRDAAEKQFMAMGGVRMFQEDPPVVVLTVNDGLPWVKFRAEDIELMREAVAKHDAAQTPKLPTNCHGLCGKCDACLETNIVKGQGASASVQASSPIARPRSEWSEEEGAVLWWAFPIVQPPYVGDPRWSDFPKSEAEATHWTPFDVPASPFAEVDSTGQRAT